MNKKQLNEMSNKMGFIFARMEDIEYELVCTLEFTIKNNILFDRHNQLVMLNDKHLCYPKHSIENKSVMHFDPFMNTNIAKFILKQYLKNLYIDSNRQKECKNYSLSPIDFFTGKGYASCRFTDGTEIKSDNFHIETIKFIDLIYKLEENNNSRILTEIDDFINFIQGTELIRILRGDNIC